MKKYRYILLLGLLIIHVSRLYAVQAVITSFKGNVGVRLEQSNEILPVSVGKLLVPGVVLITGEKSSAELTLSNGHMIFVDEKTALKIETLDDTDAKFNLPKGTMRAKVSKLLDNQTFDVNTPAATCSIRGTEFEVAVNDIGKTLLSVFTGIVEAKEMVTGKSVMVGAGQFSSVVQGQPPAAPEALEDAGSDEGKRGQDSADDRFAEARKEIFEEISKQDVLNQAAEDIKNAEYQNGKALIDAFGKRVRLEEYIMRPQADQFKYVVLNKREDRFDFGKILFTFNTSLPEDLTTATQNMFQREDEAPAWYPTDILSVVSNTIDTVTEDASGGHPESASSGGSLYYNTVFDKYDFYANSTRLWGYDKTIVPEDTYYHGDTAPTSSWTQPDGSTIFHFIGKDIYSDGTWIQAEDYIINDDGDVASVSDVVDPSNVSADDIRSRILQMNFERVYTSSLFDGRKIDLVYSAKLLSDAGILNLPSSLSAPSLNCAGASRYSGAPIQLAKFKKAPSGDIFPEPEKPYEQDSAPKVHDDSKSMIQQVASVELLGGQYFVEGDNTSLKGNIDLLYVPVINLSEKTAILPIYTADYRGTKGVEELVGGGTLVQTTMKHALYGKIVHQTESDMTYKGTGGVSGEWLAETEDERLSDGLFNNYRYTLGFEAEKELNTGRKLRIGYDFGITDYINYQALSSDDRFADAGVTSSMGTDVLNFNSHDIIVGYSFPLSERAHITSDYRISYLMFADQKIIGRSGEYAGTKRNDMGNTLNITSIMNTPKARLGLGYGLQYYLSNQNAYDADRTHYNENYYDYLEQKITPSISFLLGKDMSSVSFYWDFTLRNYLDRNVQNVNGDYGTSTVNQTTNGFGMGLSYPVFHQVALRMKLNYLMSTSNMKYESSYTYNYDVVNYFIGFAWSL